MKWKEWKRVIRAALDAAPGFNVEDDDLTFFDIVDGEHLTVIVHTSEGGEIRGIQSSKNEDEEIEG